VLSQLKKEIHKISPKLTGLLGVCQTPH